MANQSLFTTYGKQVQCLQTYFSLTASIPALNSPTIPLTVLYGFLSKPTTWPGLTPVPTEDVYSLKQAQKNMFVAKRIKASDVSVIIQRIDWTSGTTYDEYSDKIDMFEIDPAGQLIREFYVKNSFDQIFKCLYNNGGSPSTDEPFFQPGQYNTQNIFQGSDGYKWKFMYTIDIGNKIKFLDANWIPVPVVFIVPDSLTSSEGAGGLEVINITSGGVGYSNSNVISVIVSGDGQGATARANRLDATGAILDVEVLTPGSNYTTANVTFVSASGSGATASAPTSPVGGHGFDVIAELGARNLMVSAEFDGNEELNNIQYIPTDLKYFQMGLLINPTDLTGYPNSSNGDIFKTTTDLLVSQGPGQYDSGEFVYQSPDGTLPNQTWIGTILSFDSGNSVISVINTTGTVSPGSQIFGATTGTTRTLLSITTPNFDIYSGYVIYIQNLDGVTRSADGIEQFKIVLGH